MFECNNDVGNLYSRESVRLGQGRHERPVRRVGDSDSQDFKSLRRGVLRPFWDLKAENGVFFRTEVFLDSTFSFFSLDFFITPLLGS